jgi:HEAT repeat protein
MLRLIVSLRIGSVLALTMFLASHVAAAEMKTEDAWKAMPKYQYGNDMAALLTIDREVIRATATPTARSACAARLAAILEDSKTTPAAKQYICCQLRQVGTAAEVPLLTRLLADPNTSQIARYALEAIPGDESLAALRKALDTLQGGDLIGAINSVAARKDAQSVVKLKELATGKDAKIAAAAFWALGNISNTEAIAFIQSQIDSATGPMPQDWAVCMIRCADALSAAGEAKSAQAIYAKLADTVRHTGIRRAAIEAILKSEKIISAKAILPWLTGPDLDRRAVAAGHLADLSTAELDQLAKKIDVLPADAQLGVFDQLAKRKGKAALPMVLAAIQSDKPELRIAGIAMLGRFGDASSVPILADLLAKDEKTAEAAQKALYQLPRETVGKAMLAAVADRPDIRRSAIDVLAKLKYYEAIDPLVAIAGKEDAAVYQPALDALQGIADPDDRDLSRLVKLLLATKTGKHREDVERTIVVVCKKSTAKPAELAKPVLAALAKVDASESPKYLPLLGRLGGPEALKKIDAALKSNNAAVAEAAVRALCNWPNADQADRLWKLANEAKEPHNQWALRAYVRVVTLKSKRPEAETLKMLQNAMKLAKTSEDRQWILTRASTIRTLDAVAWIAGYLDDPAVNQTACQSIVDLAHHRFLRHPNMDRFGPLLDKVGRTSKDPKVVERAKKYRLGM